MLPKILCIPAGASCIIMAALQQDFSPETALAAGFLAAFGTACVLCSGFLGGFTRFGGSRLASSPKLEGDGIFIFVGWALLILSAAIIGWLYWQSSQLHPAVSGM